MTVKRGFTLVELLVVIAIIGVLIALLLPAVQQAREAARRMQCSNNLKQLSLALHNYHDAHQTFPIGVVQMKVGVGTGASWLTRLLPYMEQGAAYDQITFDKTNWSGQASWPNRNWSVMQELRVPGLNCPSSPLPTTRVQNTNAKTKNLGAPAQIEYQVSDYAGNAGAYNSGADITQLASPNLVTGYGSSTWSGVLVSLDQTNGKVVGFRDIVDGTTNTVAMVEQSDFAQGTICPTADCDWRSSNHDGGAWSSGAGGDSEWWLNVTVNRYTINWNGSGVGVDAPYRRHTVIRSPHPGGAMLALTDGSARFFAETMNITTLTQFFDRADGAVINDE